MGRVDKNPEKCSAVSTMDRGIPRFEYSHLVKELRSLVIADINSEPDKFGKEDTQRVYNDEWFVARYLLRVRCDVKEAHRMMRESLEFRNSPKIAIREFPHEFYRIGAVFDYEPDRKGNIPVWCRIRINQKIPLVQEFLKAFLFHIIEEADKKANGKGIVLIFDMQGAGLSNVDMDLLSFIAKALISYFPKGLSYFLVHELPWILKSIWGIAKQWLSEEHKQLVKFSDSSTIYEYFTEENLPDFVGGTCTRDYRSVPSNSITISQAAKQWNISEEECQQIRKKFAAHLPPTVDETAGA